jgi:hypothetical protein
VGAGGVFAARAQDLDVRWGELVGGGQSAGDQIQDEVGDLGGVVLSQVPEVAVLDVVRHLAVDDPPRVESDGALLILAEDLGELGTRDGGDTQ